MNFWTIEFMGTVNVNLNLTHGKTGAVLLTAPYQGHYNEKSMGGLEGTWERVMNAALERMVSEVSTDPKLLQVLKSISSGGAVAGKRDASENGRKVALGGAGRSIQER